MTQEEKELLLIDLCARLPYGVVLVDDNGDKMPLDYKGTITNKRFTEVLSHSIEVYGIKPYLRPMASMTKDEREEYENLYEYEEREYNQGCNYFDEWKVNIDDESRLFKIADWLNKHHFDYRGLIERGLALEAPEGMYNLNHN